MAKPIINYHPVAQRNPATGGTIYVPTIVERDQTVDLESLIESAADRGVIVGIKPAAGKSVANALGEQMYAEFRAGRSIRFGEYFYGKLYLDGQCGPDGRLDDGNGINIRLVKGPKFRIPFDSFQYQNIDSDLVPKLDFVVSDCAGAERNTPVTGEVLLVNGSRLEGNNMTSTVEFWQVDSSGQIVGDRADYSFSNFIAHGPNLLSFDLGTTILPRKYIMKVVRTHSSGVRTESLGLAVTVVANA